MFIRRIGLKEICEREPYYLRCDKCGKIILYYDKEYLKEEANRQGWRYNPDRDEVLCPKCAKELEKEEEK